tara:strand:- start:643 stop:777 length:135 start_codon:yes stop_codon:yes gene_type:complete
LNRLELAAGFISIREGHLDIHQHRIERMFLGYRPSYLRDGFGSI